MNLKQAADFLRPFWQKLRPASGPATHDYSLRCPGHDYTFTPVDHGKRGKAMGWGRGLESGDYLILKNGSDSTRYRIESVVYFGDPADMWSAKVIFAPRDTSSVEPLREPGT